MRTKEELTQIALGVITNTIFMTQDLQHIENAFKCVLVLLDKEQHELMTEQKPAAFFEYWHKAGPASLNGDPIFFSMQWITAEEWPLFYAVFAEKRKALYGEEVEAPSQ
jgi:hypothetical protein